MKKMGKIHLLINGNYFHSHSYIWIWKCGTIWSKGKKWWQFCCCCCCCFDQVSSATANSEWYLIEISQIKARKKFQIFLTFRLLKSSGLNSRSCFLLIIFFYSIWRDGKQVSANALRSAAKSSSFCWSIFVVRMRNILAPKLLLN